MGPIRVVLADDADHVRALVRDLLELDGRFRVVGEASNGSQALCVVTRERPEVVVLDVSMPVMNGLDTLPVLRERHPNLGIVVMSSYDARDMAPSVLAAGADAYVEKGVTLTSLSAALLDACRARGLLESKTPALSNGT